jgi:hypothetical protein
MNKVISSDSQKEELEIDYYSWLTDEEEELFERSGFENIKDWIESFYGVSVDFWMEIKQTTKILKQSAHPVRQTPTPPLPSNKDLKLARERARNIAS